MIEPKKDFPVSKVELHQWANTLLLTIIGVLIWNDWTGVKTDIKEHTTQINDLKTRVAVIESGSSNKKQSFLTYPLIGSLPKEIQIESETD